MRRSPDHVSVSRSLAIALLEMAKLFSNLITLLMLFVGVNAGGGEVKTGKMKVMRKPR